MDRIRTYLAASAIVVVSVATSSHAQTCRTPSPRIAPPTAGNRDHRRSDILSRKNDTIDASGSRWTRC